MKPARLIILVIALAAGGIAAWLARGTDRPAEPAKPAPQLATTEVLVAKQDIGIGHAVGAADVQWQIWPEAAAGPQFIRKSATPGAIEQVAGSIARTPFGAGEPIRESKLIKANGSGYLAALLPAGMRAISIEITPESGAAGFILPNDRVDLILTRADKRSGEDAYNSETVLANIRVLAIDQTVEEKNGQKVVIGKVATLELSPRQAEKLALSRRLGALSLALRSLADSGNTGEETDDEDVRSRSGVNIVRYGVGRASAQ